VILFYRIVVCGLAIAAFAAMARPQRPTTSENKDAASNHVSVRLQSFAQRLQAPVALTHGGDGSGRLFVVEQAGIVRVIQQGRVRDAPFLDIRDRVVSGGETGLLGLAFHPKFAENRRLYLNYTDKSGGLRTVVSAWQADATASRVVPKNERVLLTIRQPYANHNGGQIAFGPDGHLYIGMGDGGAGNDPHDNAQNLASLLGKMLRIDVDAVSGAPYGIPPDNPFINTPGAAPEIWAYGLRNPWRFSFDRASGLLYAGDVGQGAREEIDVIRRGENHGWRRMEGTICTPGVRKDCDRRGTTPPILDYPRSEGSVVIGGYVYRGLAIPALVGRYVYGDFGNGKIWTLRYDGTAVREQHLLLATGRNISAFGEDEAGELYVVDYGGEVLKIVPTRP